jgi:hypothetical protein
MEDLSPFFFSFLPPFPPFSSSFSLFLSPFFQDPGPDDKIKCPPADQLDDTTFPLDSLQDLLEEVGLAPSERFCHIVRYHVIRWAVYHFNFVPSNKIGDVKVFHVKMLKPLVPRENARHYINRGYANELKLTQKNHSQCEFNLRLNN